MTEKPAVESCFASDAAGGTGADDDEIDLFLRPVASHG